MIIVRTILAEPKTALAGATPETSFARFKPSMATFKDEMVRSFPLGFGRRELVCMVEIQGGHEEGARRTGCKPDESRRPSSNMPRANRPYG